jgi:5'-methylthioadenosine phosphorylase
MAPANLLILIAVLLPPKALDVLGTVVEERSLLTPYGEAGPLARRVGSTGIEVWVQPYTGLPTRTDPRATIYAAKQLGAQRILNWDTAIALNPVLQRGEPAVVVDYIAWINHQADTFFTTAPMEMDASAANVRTAFCPELTSVMKRLMPGVPEVGCLGADFLRRETPAEARMFRMWGADVLSYNLVPEVALAQEMGLCYAGLVTIGALGADRRSSAAQGEMRSTLHALADLLPAFAEAASMPIGCNCNAVHQEVRKRST